MRLKSGRYGVWMSLSCPRCFAWLLPVGSASAGGIPNLGNTDDAPESYWINVLLLSVIRAVRDGIVEDRWRQVRAMGVV